MGLIAPRELNNTVIVKSKEQLGDIRGDVKYLIDGLIDMGSLSIDISSVDINLTGGAGGREVCGLYSSVDGHTMFVGESAGNVYMSDLSLNTTGTGSKLFDITNSGNASFEFQNINFGGFGAGDSVTSMGEVTNYRQGFMSGCGFYFVNDGLTLSGAWGGFVVQDSNVINPTTAMSLLKEGTSLTFSGSVRSNINFLSVNASSVFADFQESNFLNKESFSLNNLRTTATNAIPNISGASSYARFINCDGVKNTYIGGQWYISTATGTTISSTSVPVKLAGTTTYQDLQHFTQTTDNAFVYDGDNTIEVEVKGNLSFSGSNGDVINLYVRLWDDSASSYVDLSETAGSTLNSAGKAEGVSFNAIGTMDNNDRIELWVENETVARNITALVNGYVIVSERQS